MLHQILETTSDPGPFVLAANSDGPPTCSVSDYLPRAAERRTILRHPRAEEVEALRRDGSRAMGAPVAPADVVMRVMQRDPDTVWVFETDGRISGGAAFLFLSDAGVAALQAGVLNPHDPAEECLVRRNERPTGVYFWGIYRADAHSGGIREILEMLESERFRGADLWTFPTGPLGRAFFEKIGLQPTATVPNLYRRIRAAS